MPRRSSPTMNPTTRVRVTPEVASAICACIAENAFSTPEGSVQGTAGVPVVRRKWRRVLANVMVLNKTFHDACAPHLWGTLHGLVPLLLLLGVETELHGEGPPTLRFQSNSIATGLWHRFRHYSSYVRRLILGPGDQAPLDPSSMTTFSIGLATAQVDVFENLNLIHLNSDDGFSVYLATTLLCQGKSSTLNLGPLLPHTDAAILYGSRGSLTRLRIDYVVPPTTLHGIATLFKLQSLSLSLHADTNVVFVNSIAGLCDLQELTISQAHLEPKASTHSLDNSTTSQCLLLPRLRSLSISAAVPTQCHFQRILTPITSLESLHLRATSSGLACLIPSIIGNYASRNFGIRSLNVEVTDLELTSKSVRRLRDDHEDRTAKFLRSLSSLIHLRNFCMVNVPFFETTIVGRVVEVAKLLSNLRIFHFLPVPVTSRPKDQLVLGNLHLLEKLTRDNTNLRFVETPVCIGDGPVPAAEEVPGEHPLEKLSIFSDGLPLVSLSDKLKLAAYIDSKFPRLKELSHTPRGVKNEASIDFWRDIRDLVMDRQKVRDQVWRTARPSWTMLASQKVSKPALSPVQKEYVSSDDLPAVAVLAEPYDSEDSEDMLDDEEGEAVDELKDDEPKPAKRSRSRAAPTKKTGAKRARVGSK
ncbi:hypothetical protein FA13DRAFT_1712932 [Coprinellus micaceus]|uniref:Uncharacterized protein n=1 Tax=Coprinellus micaceus TaxID=71717 RepID=A0A4Y7SYK5_COPMI|nr:hypothetical protein FA13DRAFT_1712932 [Coprinellus micaceus]